MAAASDDFRRLKLTGAKVFASDFRPRDLAGWPTDCAHALLLRSSHVDRPFQGLRLDRLADELQPDVVVTAAHLKQRSYRNSLREPDKDMQKQEQVQILVPQGKLPDYLSQPVAVVIYLDFDRFWRAARELREDRGIVSYGRPRKAALPDMPIERDLEAWARLQFSNPQRQAHFIFREPGSGDYSQWTDGRIATFDGRDFLDDKQQPSAKAKQVFDEIKAACDRPSEWAVEMSTFTQQVDPAFLEPEAGLGWMDHKASTLRLLLGTQSPAADRGDIWGILHAHGSNNTAVGEVEIVAKDCGGGFGGRDKSPFPVYLALASVFCPRPVRLAYDRYEQFQGGLKRHASAVKSFLQADKDGNLDVLRSFVVLAGGVEANLNGAVLGLAALHAGGPYRLKQASVHGVVLERPVPTVGSMRGFGIPQVAFNIETAIDRLAILKFGDDPIRFRLKNLLVQRGRRTGTDDVDIAGTPLDFHLANQELCQAALAHPLWRDREEQRQAAPEGTFVGVGFACCMQAYGTSKDSVYAAVQLEPDGSVVVWGETIDMGQGARRALQQVAGELLGAPTTVRLDDIAPFRQFEARLQGRQDLKDLKIDLRHGASSASKTAFFHVHVIREACRALLRLILVPAARRLLRDPSITDDDLVGAWKDGAFRLPGKPVVELASLAAALERDRRQRYLVAHGYFCNGWSSRAFVAEDGRPHQAFVDSIAIARVAGEELCDATPAGEVGTPKEQVGPGGAWVPRSAYASGGHLVGVEISTRRASIRVTDAVSFLDAGDRIIRSVVEGQVEGGLAMGISHALFEELPQESGEDRYTNFDRYVLPRADDLLAIRRETIHLPLPPLPAGVLKQGEPPIRHKGIGEVTMTTVAPAIANAVAHALRNEHEACWPRRLPIRFSDISALLPRGGQDARADG